MRSFIKRRDRRTSPQQTHGIHERVKIGDRWFISYPSRGLLGPSGKAMATSITTKKRKKQ